MNKTTEAAYLEKFLAAFNVADLGEGDAMTGANLLATMSVTLGNIARPASDILSPDGRIQHVGCNLLATGSLLSSLVTNEVITPVGRCQDNLLGQLTRLLKKDAAEGIRWVPNHAALE